MTGSLIFIGLILVILNVLSIKKQNKSFNGVLGNAIEETHDYDIKIGELRLEFSESILELQKELLDVKEIIENNNNNNNNEKINKNVSYLEAVNNKEIKEKIHEENISEIIIDISPNKNSEKVEEIKRLFSEGQSVEEVAETLHLGKGEVLLIKDLYIR